ncbi:YihY family inner membrane protein [Basilea psittacipulmonis]|uniref:YihY family inner membrane protein n=1 Tax=Basilea psittacipulmonis TaxID=1472345 RepID=UPI0006919D27|nr:YihY family inner membrane protein [Basilea psittacipulmonis]
MISLTRQQWLSFLKHLIREIQRTRILDVAGSLTFTTTLAVVPLLAVILSLFTAFPIFKDFQVEVEQFMMHNLLPETMSSTIQGYLTTFANSAKSITTWGMIFLMITSILLIKTIDDVLNRIANVSQQRHVIHRILVYWAVLTLGPIMLGASLWVTSWVASAEFGFTSLSIGLRLSYAFLNFLLFTVAFTLLYFVVPNRRIAFKDAFIGGIIASILAQAMKTGFTWYITTFPSYTLIYGAFAAIPIFLIWIYLSWTIVLLGAIIATSLPQLNINPQQQRSKKGHQFIDCLAILSFLSQLRDHHQPDVNNIEIAHKLNLLPQESDTLLRIMKKLHYVTHTSQGKWTLSCDNDQAINQLAYHFIFDQSYLNPSLHHIFNDIFIKNESLSLRDSLTYLHHPHGE